MKNGTRIIRPIITEHSMAALKKGICTFEVERYSGKQMIRTAIESLYGVHVVDICTDVRKGKTKRVGKRRLTTRRKDRKIARVRLKKGEKISAFEATAS